MWSGRRRSYWPEAEFKPAQARCYTYTVMLLKTGNFRAMFIEKY